MRAPLNNCALKLRGLTPLLPAALRSGRCDVGSALELADGVVPTAGGPSRPLCAWCGHPLLGCSGWKEGRPLHPMCVLAASVEKRRLAQEGRPLSRHAACAVLRALCRERERYEAEVAGRAAAAVARVAVVAAPCEAAGELASTAHLSVAAGEPASVAAGELASTADISVAAGELASTAHLSEAAGELASTARLSVAEPAAAARLESWQQQ